ncbi:hypothetical protein B0T14DRAFT_516405 [Immersiella caudata]|uniref:Tyrosine specific protein phosphatases domain-containing protein n=1 Tax=Immersiella caudata TaxID=314043 RepID=A0AA39WYC3_9PEZI|nr:hypothetical protein B0T14DRAFT_516405 [Immersiella caudata]
MYVKISLSDTRRLVLPNSCAIEILPFHGQCAVVRFIQPLLAISALLKMNSYRSQSVIAHRLLPIFLVTGAGLALFLYQRRMASLYDAKATDSPLLERNSEVKSFSTSRATYNGVRVFFRQHPQADKLPQEPAKIPLLVFVHGLGGSVAQFTSLLTSLTPIAPCLAVDLPGCGVSEYSNTSWNAYDIDALAELLETIIESYRESNQGVVLIGHSLGASLAALVAAPRVETRFQILSKQVLGLVAVCPKAGPHSEKETRRFRALLSIPEFIFNLWRAWDRRGGPESPSVRRFVGADADPEVKRLQHLYNCQSRTPVFRRMAWGSLPTWRNGRVEGGMPGEDVWSRLNMPVFLIGGEDDNVCPPEEVDKIAGSDLVTSLLVMAQQTAASIAPVTRENAAVREFLVENTSANNSSAENASEESASAENDTESSPHDYASLPGDLPKSVSDIRAESFYRDKIPTYSGESSNPVTPGELTQHVPPLSLVPTKSMRKRILPKPATHALLYTPSTVPILAGLISDFLAQKVTGRLDLAWQLQYLCRDGKWDVKNLEKWKSVNPVSMEIGGVFHAIKTLREVDEVHCPREFVRNWGEIIRDVIDISHDNPVYNPAGLEAAGIRYHKFPTVSKVPPTDIEVKGFIELVDKIRAAQKERQCESSMIGVHCHYGFNRTGFLIVSYLVERCGYTPIAAIEHFAQQRPHGIRHAHFKDRLCVRYSGLKTEGQ